MKYTVTVDAVDVCAGLYLSLKKTEETGQSFTYALQQSVAVNCPDFHEIHAFCRRCRKEVLALTESHEYPTNGIFVDTRLRTDKQMDGSGLHFVKNAQ
jgi:hypothetical protein